MAYTRNVEHNVVPVDCMIVIMANKKWIEPGKFLWRQPTPNKVKAMIKQLEEMTFTEQIRATTLLAWRWPSAWKTVRENMRAQELKVKKKKTRKAAKKAVLKPKAVARGKAKVGVVRRPSRAKTKSIVMAVLKPKAVAKGNAKAARTLRRFPEGDRKDCEELILSVNGSIGKPVPANEMLQETLERICRPVPVVMAASLPDPLPPRVSAVPGAHKQKVWPHGGLPGLCLCPKCRNRRSDEARSR
jgi:hypothetical protein